MYREHITGICYGVYEHGLSLCIQGTLIFGIDSCLMSRFIPVYTGNAYYYRVSHRQFSVYPSVYRERYVYTSIRLVNNGLSLCIQGTQTRLRRPDLGPRFIPVYTGNANACLISSWYKCGLSLCIQGTLYFISFHFPLLRFIPVYTGNAPIITYCFIFKILTAKFLPIFWDIFH